MLFKGHPSVVRNAQLHFGLRLVEFISKTTVLYTTETYNIYIYIYIKRLKILSRQFLSKLGFRVRDPHQLTMVCYIYGLYINLGFLQHHKKKECSTLIYIFINSEFQFREPHQLTSKCCYGLAKSVCYACNVQKFRFSHSKMVQT